MDGDQWRIIRHRVPLCGIVYQACVLRGREPIPIGPVETDLEALRSTLTDMVEACDKPIVDRVTEGI